MAPPGDDLDEGYKDEWGPHPARLLVGVGDDAADEVGLSLVQGVHQGGELDQVDRGHRLPTTSLLLLTLRLLFLRIECNKTMIS